MNENLTHVPGTPTRGAVIPGMAHFAGTGPSGATCRLCVFWQHLGYHASGGKHKGVLKPAHCRKYTSLMQGNPGPSVEHSASACRHFEKSKTPPTIREKRA